jgi:hypothetical protein
MRLFDELENTEYSVGDIIEDDFGTEWYILGYSSHGWVQVIENEKLAEVAQKFFLGTFGMRLEYDNV